MSACSQAFHAWLPSFRPCGGCRTLPRSGYTEQPSEIISTAVVVITSALVPLVIGVLNKQRYDYSELAKVQDLQTSRS